jgi:hypothetical protein
MLKRKLSIIIGLLIFVGLALFIFTYSYFKNLPSKITPSPSASVPTTSDQKLQTAEELQRDLNNYNQAQVNQDPSLCQAVIDAQSKDFCIGAIASSTKNTATCLSIISEATKNDCVSGVLSKIAVENHSLLGCQKIEQTMIAKDCVEQIAAAEPKIDCRSLTDASLANSCLSLVYYNQAKAKNDSQICSLIPELIRRANCLSEVGKIDLHSDTDKDGLDFLQEILSSTNPSKADTDGDGHPDGEEVKGGFNPDGVGLISEPMPMTSINCRDIDDKGIKSLCVAELKDKPLDYSKCSIIKNVTLKNYCLDLLNKNKK